MRPAFKDLFNSSLDDSLARLKLLHSNALSGITVTFLCMLVLCFGFDSPDTQDIKNVVFVCLCFAHTLRIADNIYFGITLKADKVLVKAAAWRFCIGIIGNSLIWAIYAWLLIATMTSSEVMVAAIILSALAGGTITILAASTTLSVFYMSCLLIPFTVQGFFSNVEYIHYISYLGMMFWLVMMVAASKAGHFVTQVLTLKNQNSNMIALMDSEKAEVQRVNQQLSVANDKLDSYAHKLETEVESRTAKIYHLSNIDPLTNLSNRTAFSKKLKQTLGHPIHTTEQFVLLFIDLDGFKDVNDGFGHKVGDAVLTHIAKRLETIKDFIVPDIIQEQTSKHENLICRWGGDEFLVFSKFHDQTCVDKLVRAIQVSVQEPINIASNKITLGASIGISKYPQDSITPSDLIQYADISMYQHKKSGLGDAVYFSHALFDEFQHEQTIRDGLKNALQLDEFSLVFHPIINIVEDKPWAMEALIRWHHKGVDIRPDEFIAIAEKAGHIIQIGAWVLMKACKEAATWHFDKSLAVSVNVSSLQLLDETFIARVEIALSASGLNPNRLHIEITESVMLDKCDLASAQLKSLTAMGIHVSIDDFGTGYSSLNQLQNMSFDIIKIDRSFLQDLSQRDLTIISATKLIADEFDAITVAEGIETIEELHILQDVGITHIQGFLFAKPMLAQDIEPWFDNHNKLLVKETSRP